MEAIEQALNEKLPATVKNHIDILSFSGFLF